MDIRNLLNICRRKDEREGGRKEGGKKYGNSQLKVNKVSFLSFSEPSSQ